MQCFAAQGQTQRLAHRRQRLRGDADHQRLPAAVEIEEDLVAYRFDDIDTCIESQLRVG